MLFCKREKIATCQTVHSANLSGTRSFQKMILQIRNSHNTSGRKEKTTQEIRMKFNQNNVFD